MALTYRFGRFELNPATRQLLVDKQPALLGARALDILLALIERRDRLVTKNELLDLVWPGLVVEENNLQVQISTLRKLLGSDAIATIPGRGYRFTAAVDGTADGKSATAAARGDQTELQAPAAVAQPAIAGPKGERRQLTILFADLVGATALSGQIDPEALRDILLSYQRVTNTCVDAYGGRVHQYLGDGVLAYFGYPAAHDNDAERAVLAGLALVAAVGKLSAAREARGESGIQARVGVHTGVVVIGAVGAEDSPVDLAVGETPNLAARIEAEAAPNSVCISAATRNLLGPQFKLRELEPRPLKGVAKATAIFAVEGGSDPAPDWEAGRNLTPLVGRDSELQHLLQRWHLARSGHGQTVLISGEAGIGKSRLLAALHAQIAPKEEAWRVVRCSPFHANNAFHPVIDLIDRAIDAQAASVPVDRERTLGQLLAASGIDDEVGQTLLCSLLGLGEAEVLERRLAELAPMQRRQRTLEALIAWLQADARKYATVVVIEDLHWADPSSRDLFGILLERIADSPVLLVLTFRPDFVPPWPLRAQMSTMALSRLASDEVSSMARNLTAGLELPTRIVDEIVRRTDGVPLFVEELTKAIIAAGLVVERDGVLHVADDVAGLFEVPASLRDSLTARLDRLGAAKVVAQLASVLGREFDYSLLHAVCDVTEAELEAQLAALGRADIVQQSGMPPRAHYRFKHALLQEAAYDTLLNKARIQLHRRVAEAYVTLFPQVLQTKPELAAHHFGRAAMPGEAVPYWRKAGELALARSGDEEAISHLGSGLEQIERMPASDARDAAELGLRVAVGTALLARRGFGAAEAGENYARACDLAETQGESSDRFAAKWGDWLFKNTRGQLVAATRRSEELVDLGRTLADDGYLLQAHHSRWTNLLFLGQFADARADTQEGLRLFDRARHRHHKHVYGGHDPYVCALNFGASAACAMGRADESRRLLDDARSIARELNHIHTSSIALLFGSILSHELGDADRAGAESEELLALCERHGFAQWVGTGRVALGAALCSKGNPDAGIAMAEAGVESQLARGPVGFALAVLAVAARAHLQWGTPERALTLLLQALELADRTQVGWQRPEVQRLKAETMLRIGRIGAAEAAADLHAAADLARAQGATALEARSLTSTLRLCRGDNRVVSARQRLRALCDSLDGHGSVDVDAARSILAS